MRGSKYRSFPPTMGAEVSFMPSPETFKDGANPSTGECRVGWMFQLWDL